MAEWTHPRRAAKETISYLSQIEPVVDQFVQDDHGYGGDDDEEDDIGREQMLDNVLEELKHQTASIMEDRQGSVVAEKIVRRLTPLQLRVMLSRCRGYMLSLANNRYSSHVLQTLLSVAGKVVEAELSSDDSYREENPSSASDKQQIDLMQEIVLSLVSELSGAWAELLADISGSHAGRGLLQVLGGLPILTERRGRQSRHAHSIGTAVSSSGAGTGRPHSEGSSANINNTTVDSEALEKWCTPYRYRVPPSFEAALGNVTSELAALPAAELQGLVCGTFGCPLLVMLLRVYGNLAVEPASGVLPFLELKSPAMSIVTKTLEWGDKERSKQVVYAISGENTASHFLEAVMWLSPREFFEELYHRCFKSKLLEFCEHGVSNFLIQAALQRADDKALAEEMVGAIGENAADLLRLRRAGVLWKAAQTCVRLSLKPKTQTKLLEAIARAVQAGHTGVFPPPTGSDENGDVSKEGDGDAGVSSPPSDAFKAARSWVPALLSPRLPGEGGLDRLFLNVPGARIVQNALMFDAPVAAPVLKAVAALPEAVLASVARDNLGSRCLLDPILQAAGVKTGGGKGKNKPAEDARRTILRAFRGHLVAMACDRVAWHTLLKCFRGVDMKEKRLMAEELASGGEQAWSRMSGYPSGRSVLTECMVERFSRSPHEWEEAFKNRDNRAKILTEILAVESKSAAKSGKGNNKAQKEDDRKGTGEASTNKHLRASGLAPSPFNTQPTGGDEGVGETEEDGGKGKEKRRRQRGRGKRGKSSAGPVVERGADGLDEADDGSCDIATETGDETPKNKSTKAIKGAAEKSSDGEIKGVKRKKAGKENVEVEEEETTPVAKEKKKRKRQEGELEKITGVVGANTSRKYNEGGLSFVMDATKKSVLVKPQGLTASKKDKKKKKKKSLGSSEQGNEVSIEVKVNEETQIFANGDAEGEEAVAQKNGKQKKKRRDTAKGETKMEESSSKGKVSEKKAERSDGMAATSTPKATATSEKKPKKAKNSIGFRMF